VLVRSSVCRLCLLHHIHMYSIVIQLLPHVRSEAHLKLYSKLTATALLALLHSQPVWLCQSAVQQTTTTIHFLQFYLDQVLVSPLGLSTSLHPPSPDASTALKVMSPPMDQHCPPLLPAAPPPPGPKISRPQTPDYRMPPASYTLATRTHTPASCT
jgi:hypothetical protein